MQVYIKKDKYFEDESLTAYIKPDYADRLIKSGAEIFIVRATGKIEEIPNKYKFVNMMDCIHYQTKQVRTVLRSTENNPRALLADAYDKMGKMLEQMPTGANDFKIG